MAKWLCHYSVTYIESLAAITEDAEGNLRLLTSGGVERAFLHGHRPPLMLVEQTTEVLDRARSKS